MAKYDVNATLRSRYPRLRSHNPTEWTKWGFGRSRRTWAHSHLPLLNIQRQDGERGGQSEGEINSFFNTRCACPCLPDNMLRLMCESRQAGRRLWEPAGSLSTAVAASAVAAATSHCTLVVTWGRVWRGTRGLKQTRERWMFLDWDYTQFPARAKSIIHVVV